MNQSPAKNIKDYPMTLTAKDVAEILNVSLATTYRYLRRPDFPAIKQPRTAPRVLRDALYAWMMERSAGA